MHDGEVGMASTDKDNIAAALHRAGFVHRDADFGHALVVNVFSAEVWFMFKACGDLEDIGVYDNEGSSQSPAVF